jgi:hypothetical protein
MEMQIKCQNDQNNQMSDKVLSKHSKQSTPKSYVMDPEQDVRDQKYLQPKTSLVGSPLKFSNMYLRTRPLLLLDKVEKDKLQLF